MKSWLQHKLIGEGPADGPVQQALLDLFWMMPWWFPQFILSTAGLWALFLWLARRRKGARRHDLARKDPDRSGPTVSRRRRERGRRLRGVA